jgi:hypothetical protein
LVPSGKVASTCHDPVDDIIAVENGRTESDKLGNAASVAGAFDNLVGDDGDRFRIIELQPPRAASARQFGGGIDGQSFHLGRCQKHCPSLPLDRRVAVILR